MAKVFKISREELVEIIRTKLNRPFNKKITSTRDIAKLSGYSHAYVAVIASLLRKSKIDVPKKEATLKELIKKIKQQEMLKI